jgi:hypothetical protein
MLIAESPAKSKPWPKSRLPRSGLVQRRLSRVVEFPSRGRRRHAIRHIAARAVAASSRQSSTILQADQQHPGDSLTNLGQAN